jgi:uncharacterized protein (TIGR03435 family)
MSLDEFAKTLTMYGLDRPVINRTWITGTFDLHLEYTLEEAPSGFRRDSGDAADSVGSSIATALKQQLGLRLEPANRPRDFLVVDHVEKPSVN